MSNEISGVGREIITQRAGQARTDPVVWQVQSALNAIAGRPAVREDGVFDGRTSVVLRRFQEGEGLHPSGTIDQATIDALNRRVAAVRREAPETDSCEPLASGGDDVESSGAVLECRGQSHRTAIGFGGAGTEMLEGGVARAQVILHERGGWSVRARGEVLAARAGLGVGRNEEGRGAHAGAEANIAAGEVEVLTPDGESASVGLSAGPGFGLSVRRRDADLDGRVETCVSASGAFLSGSACIEDEPF